MPTIVKPTGAPLRAKLRSQRAMREAMHFRRINVRELADLCGSNPATRSSRQSAISHLHSGARDTCDVFLARRIEEVLFERPGALFVPLPPTDQSVVTATRTRKKAA